MAPHTYQDPIGFYEWFDDLPYAIQDSILKHLPHMEGEEWLIVIILAALLLMILVSAYLGFARHNVKKTSEATFVIGVMVLATGIIFVMQRAMN